MKCSRCGTQNPDGKSICSKCGNFLYSSYPRNRVPMTLEQKRVRRKERIKQTFKGFLWMSLVLFGMMILLIVVVVILFSVLKIGG
jgi:uncharacterized membrane protein YvbJ